jgi:adenine deaminase
MRVYFSKTTLYLRRVVMNVNPTANQNSRLFLQQVPKTELHLHIEGTLEPHQLFEFAHRNGISTKFKDISELKQAYKFSNLQEFLDLYYQGLDVMQTEQDYYDLTWAYFKKIKTQNVVHAELFFDPQIHVSRGIPFKTVFNGIFNASKDAEKNLGITSKIILCILRHLDQKSAFDILNEAEPFKEHIIGIGLDSSELGNPPSKFKEVFEEARNRGYLLVAHAGEEGPSSYIWEAINVLNVARIDHGNRCLDDDKLIKYLCKSRTPLTVCPLSNLELRVISEMKNHPIKKMLDLGLHVTINSDDPAYFGGYLLENYFAVQETLDLSIQNIYQLVVNGFTSSFLSQQEKESHLKKVKKIYNDIFL